MFEKSIIKYFWSLIRPYKWYYLVMLLAPVYSGFFPLAYNYAIKLFIDTMAEDKFITYGNLLFPIGLFLAAQLGLDFIWRVSQVAEWRSEPYVRRTILLSSYGYVQDHSYKYFQDNFSGAISSKIKGILDGYDKFWAEMHHGFLSRILKSIISIGALFIVNNIVGLFMIFWSVLYGAVMYKLSTKLNLLAFSESESRHSLIGQIADKITNINSIFSFAAKRSELFSLDNQITNDFIPKQKKVYRYDFKVQIIAGILYAIMFLFLLFWMLYLRKNNFITVGDFAFVFGLAMVVADDIWFVTRSLQDFARAMGDLKSALSIVETPQENKDKIGAKELVVKSPKIEFKNAGFFYSEGQPVLKNLSFTIKPGEKIGLVGRSGAGKSSLVNLLLRYFNLTNGQILIDDQDIAEVTESSLRNSIAVIPQDVQLFHRTILENISFANPKASKEEVIAACKKAHVHDFIMSISGQYDSMVGERGIKLSGGQRQRISIARAILKHAPILILDEATSSLDSQTEKLVQESLSFLLEDKEITMIAIAHRLSTLKHMDRILVLDQGQITEEGSHEQLLSDPNSYYKRLWDLQEI